MHRLALLAALLLPLAATALEAPALHLIARDPSGNDFPNIAYTLDAIATNETGQLVITATFNAEPQSEPSLVVQLSRAAGSETRYLSMESSTWTASSTSTDTGLYTYDFTFPALPTDIDASRVLPITRGRFGRPDGTFEAGGAAVETSDGATYVGRTGTFIIGGETIEFVGGFATERAVAADETGEEATIASVSADDGIATADLSLGTGEEVTTATTVDTIAGKKLSFKRRKTK